jgi:hypothetical protein
MLTDSGFNYRRFAVFEIIPGRPHGEKRGNFVIGVPGNTAPEFLAEHTYDEWTPVVHRLLTPDEKLDITRQLGCALGSKPQFVLWQILDYRDIVQTEPMWTSPLGKKFWVYLPGDTR